MGWPGGLRKAALSWALLASVGCKGQERATAPAEPLSPAFHSGSRLRARYLDAGDGAVAFVGFHDAEFDVDCGFYPGRDGVTPTPASWTLAAS